MAANFNDNVAYVIEILSATAPVMMLVQISGLSFESIDGTSAAMNTTCPIAKTIACHVILYVRCLRVIVEHVDQQTGPREMLSATALARARIVIFTEATLTHKCVD